MTFIDYISRQSRSRLLWAAFAAMLLIGCINYLAGAEISVSILYLLPVSLVSWFVGRKEGSLLALGSSLSWYVAEMSFGRSYSHPLLHCWNLAVMFSFFIIINFTLAAFRKALDREKEFARVDALTGVTNGRQFQEMVEREVERSRRYGHPLTLLYLDCDNFKNVNDKFGHQIGNRCLKFLAAILQENVRNIDMVARLGGDEFVILMPETGEQFVPQGAQRLHARLVSALRDMGWPVTLSMGAAVYLDPPASAEELIKSADHLMLQSKNGGKNRVQYQVFGAPRPSEEAAPETRKSFSPATLPRPFQARFALHALQAADSFLNRAHSRIPGRRAAQEN